MADELSKSKRTNGGKASRLNRELATTANNPFLGLPVYGEKIRLQSRDQILADEGGNSLALGVYIDLLNDSHVYYTLNKQFSEITARTWTVEPGGNKTELDKKAAGFCKQQLEQLELSSSGTESDGLGNALLPMATGFDNLTRAMGLAVLTGIMPIENIYKREDSGLVGMDYVKPRDPRLFVFDEIEDGRIQPRILRVGNSIVGDFIPPKKFVFHRHWAMGSDDPLGQGIGKYLYWLVRWKREAMTYWLAIIDRYADPPALGEYPRTATQQQVDAFLQDIRGLSREAAMVMQEGWKLRYENAGIAGSVELLERLITYCDKAISLVVFGEATTGEQAGGSQARETINNSIRIQNAKAWSDAICSTIEGTIFKWLVGWNFPGAAIPKLVRNFTDLDEILNIAKTYKDLGLQVDPVFLAQATGVPIMKKPEKKAPTIPPSLLQ